MRSLCTTLERSPRLPQLEKSLHGHEDPVQPKINKQIKNVLIKWIANKDVPIAQGKAAQYSIITEMGKEFKKVVIVQPLSRVQFFAAP